MLIGGGRINPQRFSYGTYGDDSGVIFRSADSNTSDNSTLAISDRFINPLFAAIVDQCAVDPESNLPKIVAEWNSVTGWCDAASNVLISEGDAGALASALSRITATTVAPHVAGVTVEECMVCAGVISDFLRNQLAHNRCIYIEDD